MDKIEKLKAEIQRLKEMKRNSDAAWRKAFSAQEKELSKAKRKLAEARSVAFEAYRKSKDKEDKKQFKRIYEI